LRFGHPSSTGARGGNGAAAGPANGDRFAERRAEMVRFQLQGRDIRDPRVLVAMGRVPRHEFVPDHLRGDAYQDGPLPIGHGQTISQPYIVALTTQLALGAGARRALDVGCGSGYQAAVLAEIVPQVFSIEIVPELAETARERLARLGYTGVTVRCGDGHRGWPEAAPFDAIVVACAAHEVPPALIAQLAPGGRLVIPVGEWAQSLLLVEKRADGEIVRSSHGGVAFVPMVHGPRREAGEEES
jgi:protein-L-isoaspartate(D-aspartate) O-methyltransferase